MGGDCFYIIEESLSEIVTALISSSEWERQAHEGQSRQKKKTGSGPEVGRSLGVKEPMVDHRGMRMMSSAGGKMKVGKTAGAQVWQGAGSWWKGI